MTEAREKPPAHSIKFFEAVCNAYLGTEPHDKHIRGKMFHPLRKMAVSLLLLGE